MLIQIKIAIHTSQTQPPNNFQKMFSEFENMFSKIKNSATDTFATTETDHAHTPQKYNISGREIQELKLLSQGAFGFIWLAEDCKTKEKFALKRVICMTSQRFQEAENERKVMSLFPNSDYIVKYYGGDVVRNGDQKTVITLMELCSGGTLFDLLEKRQNQGFTQSELVKITTGIVKGLKAIHQTGYYHRDVKLENVLLNKENQYKLCDFGSSTKQTYNFAQIPKSSYNDVKQDMESLTTPMYRPPEIVDPYLGYLVNEKVDIWMAGCVLYTLCYFTHPFVDANAIGISSGTYRFLKHPDETQYRVSEKIKDLIRCLLTPNPSHRPSTDQVLQILNKWNSISQVPLNMQAVKRKEQQMEKERQMEQLNRKCVDYDGDIPIEKLMELQNKVKNKEKSSQSAHGGFISKNSSILQNKAKPSLANKVTTANQVQQVSAIQQKLSSQSGNSTLKSDPFGQKVGGSGGNVPKPKVQLNDLWGQNFASGSSNSPNQKQPQNKNAFDFFDNFGGSTATNTNTTTVKNKSNNINFQEMFMQTPSVDKQETQPSSGNAKKQTQEHNLLDF